MIRRSVLGDPQGKSSESYRPESKECISSKKWHEIVPPSYTNRGWLSTGDSLFDGVGVKDSSDCIASEDMLQASRFLDARSTIINHIDSGLRRELWDSHVWYSDSQGTFVADFPRPTYPNTIEENYLEASAILKVFRPVLELPVIRDCPCSKVRDLIEIYDEALIDLRMSVSIYGSSSRVDKEGREDDSWFVSVIIDENGTPGFDVFPAADLEKARIICGCVADSNGMSINETMVIGPFINRECATVAMNHYQVVPIEEDEEPCGYFERLKHISKIDLYSTLKDMMHVAPSCTVLTNFSPIQSVFIDEGRPRASVRIDGVEFLIDQAWFDNGEFDFAGFIQGSLKCHLKITRDKIYLDDDRGEHRTSVWSIGDVKEFIQNM